MAEEIGVHWRVVGTVLLDDKNAAVMPAIAKQFGNNSEDINMEVLSRWIQGKGIDCTWHALLDALRGPCRTLVKTIREALTEEEVTDGKPGQYIYIYIYILSIYLLM